MELVEGGSSYNLTGWSNYQMESLITDMLEAYGLDRNGEPIGVS